MKRWSPATLWTLVHIVSVLLVLFSPFVLLYDAIVRKDLEYDPNVTSHRLVDHSEQVAKLDRIAEELAFKYSVALEETKNTAQHRIIVFDCLTPRRCYGLGDRLRGISTLFYLSLLTSSSLFLNVQIPYPLLNFLTPTLYDWRINATVSYEGQVHGKACWWNDSTLAPTPLARPVGAQLLGRKGTWRLRTWDNETQWWDWLTQWPQRLWRPDFEGFDAARELSSKRMHRFICNIGYPQAWVTNLHMRQAVLAYGLDKLQPEHLFSVSMRMLFKPSPCIKAEIDEYIGMFPDWDDFRTLKIGVQIRTWVTLDGWMKEYIRPPPWECYKKQLFILMRDEVRRLALSMNNTRSRDERRLRSRVIVFLTGDSQDAVDYLMATLVAEGIRVFRTDHDPSHILESSTMDLAAKTYLDWWLLTKMDRLLITRSAFGETAAAYSLKPAVVIDGWVPDCTTWQYNYTFHVDG